jgi:hypothetical protein
MDKILVAAALALGLGSSVAIAHGPERRNCRFEQNSPECLQLLSGEKAELYGVRSLDAHRAAGEQVRRVFYVDGHGRDLLLVAAVRAHRSEPTVSVHFPPQNGRTADPLRARMPRAAWREMLALPGSFDRESTAARQTVCLHGGTYLVEGSDPDSSPGAPSALSRGRGGDCNPNSASAYAAVVERTTLALFPPCARIATHASPALRLAACGILHGDRLSAAEVLNRAEAFRMTYNASDTTRLAGLFTTQPEISWNGERTMREPAAFWAARAAPVRGVTTFIVQSVDATSANAVRLTGTLSRAIDTPRGRATGMETARVEQTWRREEGAFRVARAVVGPWQPS